MRQAWLWWPDRHGNCRDFWIDNKAAGATKQTGSFTAASNKVEKWYYNCGTGQFGKIVTFKGGKIVSIENSADRGTGDQKCWWHTKRAIFRLSFLPAEAGQYNADLPWIWHTDLLTLRAVSYCTTDLNFKERLCPVHDQVYFEGAVRRFYALISPHRSI